MLSAATVALGLYADDYDDTGTSFESVNLGGASSVEFNIATPDDIQTNGVDVTGLWATNGTPTMTVVAGSSSDGQTPPRPAQFAKNYPHNAYLSLQTSFGTANCDLVKRTINSGEVGQTIDANKGAFYFDSLVKFTAFDGDVPESVTNEMNAAKIAVWLQTNEDETQTNLYVRAGQFDNNGVYLSDKTYDCGSGIENPDGWHRLTIKAIRTISASGTVPAFMVFVDEHPVGISDHSDPGAISGGVLPKWKATYEGGSLFPSMEQGTASATELKSVSFAGTGCIDDVVFTETVPNFTDAADPAVVTITWDTSLITSLQIDGTTYTEGSAIVDYDASITVTNIVYASGYTGPSSATILFNEAGATDSSTLNSLAGDIVAYFGTTAYTNVTEAVGDANVTNEADVVLQFVKNTDAEIGIENAEGVRVKIDLNGKTIGSIVAATPVWVVDSVGGSVVNDYSSFIAGSIIDAGKYEGQVTFDGAAHSSIISNGVFKIDSGNTAGYLNDFAKEGYEFVEDDGYLVLQEKAPVVYYTIKFVYGEGLAYTGTVENVEAGTTPTAESAWEADITGKTFTGWDSTVVPAAADATYTAVYVANTYTVTFYTNSVEYATVNYTYANAGSYNAPADPSVEGYTFEGWYTDDGTFETAFVFSANVAGNTQVAYAKLTSSGGGWDPDPAVIDASKTVAQEYPALADSVLATANAKQVTTWAKDYNVNFADVAAATSGTTYSDAFLLNCAPTADAVTAATAAFEANISITFDSEGKPVVSQQAGGYNVTPQMKGSNDLSTWTDVSEASTTYKFYKYVLSL